MPLFAARPAAAAVAPAGAAGPAAEAAEEAAEEAAAERDSSPTFGGPAMAGPRSEDTDTIACARALNYGQGIGYSYRLKVHVYLKKYCRKHKQKYCQKYCQKY